MRLIPAIDIIDGKCVRLEQGDYARKKVYNQNPLEVAKSFQDAGLQFLHVVDLDGAKAGKLVNWKTVEEIAKHTQLRIDIGGGIKSAEDIRIALDSGVRQVNIGSAAVKQRDEVLRWFEDFGGDKIILSADVKKNFIAIHGWQTQTDLHVLEFIRSYLEVGLRTVTCTDIAKDGLLKGVSVDLYQEIMKEIPSINLIASGGLSSLEELSALKAMNMYGVIIGKAIYEGKISLQALGDFAQIKN